MAQSCSSEQLNALLDFLTENKELARGLLRSADGRIRAKRMWEEITELLNSLGGCVKTVQQWQKVWTDRKHLAKKHASLVNRSHVGTGGGPHIESLAQWEVKVVEIMGEGFGGPQTTARVPAFPTINIAEEVFSYYEQPQPQPPQDVAEEVTSAASQQSAITVRTLPAQNTRSSQRRIPSRRRAVRPAGISLQLIEMEEEKINILKNINERLTGIEKAILELVNLKRSA